jgi:TATA-binding protein-associated factor Taf7
MKEMMREEEEDVSEVKEMMRELMTEEETQAEAGTEAEAEEEGEKEMMLTEGEVEEEREGDGSQDEEDGYTMFTGDYTTEVRFHLLRFSFSFASAHPFVCLNRVTTPVTRIPSPLPRRIA